MRSQRNRLDRNKIAATARSKTAAIAENGRDRNRIAAIAGVLLRSKHYCRDRSNNAAVEAILLRLQQRYCDRHTIAAIEARCCDRSNTGALESIWRDHSKINQDQELCESTWRVLAFTFCWIHFWIVFETFWLPFAPDHVLQRVHETFWRRFHLFSNFWCSSAIVWSIIYAHLEMGK